MVHTLPPKCPICGGEWVITGAQCRTCQTRLEGRFEAQISPFAHLSARHLAFLEIFLRCEGKLNCVGEKMGLSYPTVRNRLRELLHVLGFEAEAEETPSPRADARRKVLDDLEAGRITAQEAMRLLGKEN